MKFPNGFGTVYKLSGNRRNPWIARITAGFEEVLDKKTGEPTKKQLYQTVGYFEEKNQAIDALTKFRIQPVVPRANLTFEELYKEWSKGKYEFLESGGSSSTVDNYKAAWKHLSKYGKVKFKELRTAHLQAVVDEQYKAKKSKSTLNKIKIVASMMYDYAIENDISNKNYAEFIRLPKVKENEKEAFSDLEVQKIEKSIGSIEWADVILMMIYTGFRITELLILTKFSVNFKEGYITGGLKTEAGKDRIVPIHAKILCIVQKWYDKNGERLICDDNGKGFSSRKFREKIYRPALEQIGVRILDPHSCRHTFATRASDSGMDTKAIQEIIGHEDYNFTAQRYTHKDIDSLKKAMEKLS